MKYRHVITATLIVSLILLAAKALYQPQTIQTSGVIAVGKIGIYWDENLTRSVTSINWGLCYPGEWSNKTLYLSNEGTVPLQVSTETMNWSVSTTLIQFYSDNLTLTISEMSETTWGVYIHPTIANVTSFSFDIVVYGDEF